MTEPEIARRCHECGASIRDHAAFCPQCGRELKTTADLVESEAHHKPSVDTAPLDEDPIEKAHLKSQKHVAEPPQRPDVNETPKTKQQRAPAPPAENQSGGAKVTPEKAVGTQKSADARGRMQRATGLAKHVGGDVVQRGQKLREMSSVVLDEASYDPSLRFVLVAAVLFFLFLIMVLLNRFIV
jgi:hypothetical protein